MKRLSIVKNRKTLEIQRIKGEVAQMLRSGKDNENARIRVEEVIRQEMILTAYARLETYLILIQTRAGMLKKVKDPPLDMLEAICTLAFAAERVKYDLDEIPAIRDVLYSKFRHGLCERYGKEFAHTVAQDYSANACGANAAVVALLSAMPPSAELKLAKLEQIAEAFAVPFDKEKVAAEMYMGLAPPPPPHAAASPYAAQPPPPPRPVTSVPAAHGQPAPPPPTRVVPPLPAEFSAAQQPRQQPHPGAYHHAQPPYQPPQHAQQPQQQQPATSPSHPPPSLQQSYDAAWAPLPPVPLDQGSQFHERLNGAVHFMARATTSESLSVGSSTPQRGNSLGSDAVSPLKAFNSPLRQGAAECEWNQALREEQEAQELAAAAMAAAALQTAEQEEEDSLAAALARLKGT